MDFPTQLNQSISVLRVVWRYFFTFNQILIEHSVSKHSAASGLGLHGLHMSHKRTLGLYGLICYNAHNCCL